MKTQTKTTQLTILGLMTAVLLLMAYTPLGYLNIGPLAITFNVIPVAICAITLGPAGGAAAAPFSASPVFCNVSVWAEPVPWGRSFLRSIRFSPSSSASFPVFWTVYFWDTFSVQ